MAQLLAPVAPSSLGVDARGVIALVDALEAEDHDPHSLVLARHGHVAARGWWAPYTPDRVQLVYSLSKSFAATAVGLLVDAGRLSLDDRVFDVIPASEVPAGATVSDRYRRLTLGHCLTMATGHDTDAWGEETNAAALRTAAGPEDPVLAAVLAHDPEHEPGTAWAYNQAASYLVGAVVRATTGGSLLDLLGPGLLAALDPDAAAAARWHLTATGRELGFSGFHVGTDAVLALAQTHLDHGRWQGSQLLSDQWVATATTPTGLPNREPDANPDWRHGYGCSFWAASHGYRGDGAFGQFAIVLPEQDVALAITSETTDMQAVLDLVWEHLLPALDQPGDPRADAELDGRMAGLQVPTPPSTAAGPRTADWVRSADSELPERYTAARLTDAAGGGWVLDLDVDGTSVPLRVGDGRWLESLLAVDEAVLPVVAAGGWGAAGEFRAELRLVETPHRILVHGRRDGSMRLTWRQVPLHGADPAMLAVRSRDEVPGMPG
jgi:CubicO group peptidase (beta-lactamase class C family)